MDNEQMHSFMKNLEEEWSCPINKMPIYEPVTTIDGHTYEKQAIAHWLLTERKSPKTNLELSSTQLIPNHAFKSLVSRLNQQLPIFLAKQAQDKIDINHLLEQIKDLKQELSYQKERCQQLQNKQERQSKQKKIQKGIFQSKRNQVRQIRQQKNKYQKLYQQNKSLLQQKNREIQTLKEQMQNVSARFDQASTEKRRLQVQNTAVILNRAEFIKKLKFTFVSNLSFICHLLKSIQDVTQLQRKIKGNKPSSVNTLEIIQENPQSLKIIPNSHIMQGKHIMEILEQKIRKKVNKTQWTENQSRQRLMGIIRTQNLAVQQNGEDHQQVSQQNAQHDNVQLNNGIVQENILNPLQREAEEEQDSELYQQLKSLRWMMSKRRYQEIPRFYSMQQCITNEPDSNGYWYGVKLDIKQSNIPFEQFLDHSWSHIRWLNLADCEIDDRLWQKFIDNIHKFQNLMYLNLFNNKITMLKKKELEKFNKLVRLITMKNNLTQQSVQQLHKYAEQNPKCSIRMQWGLMRPAVHLGNEQINNFIERYAHVGQLQFV